MTGVAINILNIIRMKNELFVWKQDFFQKVLFKQCTSLIHQVFSTMINRVTPLLWNKGFPGEGGWGTLHTKCGGNNVRAGWEHTGISQPTF